MGSLFLYFLCVQDTAEHCPLVQTKINTSKKSWVEDHEYYINLGMKDCLKQLEIQSIKSRLETSSKEV